MTRPDVAGGLRHRFLSGWGEDRGNDNGYGDRGHGGAAVFAVLAASGDEGPATHRQVAQHLASINTVAASWFRESTTSSSSSDSGPKKGKRGGNNVCQDGHEVKALKQHQKCLEMIVAYEDKAWEEPEEKIGRREQLTTSSSSAQ